MSISWRSPALAASMSPPAEPCELDHKYGARSESFTLDAFTATVRLLVPTLADAYIISNDLYGQLVEWPYLPGSGMYCSGCKLDPVDSKTTANGAGLDYESYIITASFSTFPGAKPGHAGGGGTHGEPQALWSAGIEGFGDHITLATHRQPTKAPTDVDDPLYGTGAVVEDLTKAPIPLYRWGSLSGDPLDTSEGPGKPIPHCEFWTKWQRMPSLPGSVGDVLFLTDHTNGDEIETEYGTFAEDTLLAMSPTISKNVTTTGTTFDLSLKFGWREHGWNKFWRSKSGRWESIVYAEDVAESSMGAGDGHSAGDLYRNFEQTFFSWVLPDYFA